MFIMGEPNKDEAVPPMTKAALAALLNDASDRATKAAIAAFASLPSQAGSVQIAHLGDLLPKQQNEEEKFAAQVMRPVADRSLIKETAIECRTIGNPGVTSDGATFTAIAIPHPRFPNGKVVRLDNYKEPVFDEHNLPKSQGDGRMATHLPDGRINPMFRDYVWKTFYQADLLRYVGIDAGQLPRLPVNATKAA